MKTVSKYSPPLNSYTSFESARSVQEIMWRDPASPAKTSVKYFMIESIKEHAHT